MAQPFQKLTTMDRVINQIQDNVAFSINPLTQIPLNSGILLQQQILMSGSNSVNHKLGRQPVGWFIVSPNAAVTVYETPSTTPTLTLNLVSSGNVTCSIYVF